MKPKKHLAEQLVSPVLDPNERLSLTLMLKGDLARDWRRYKRAHTALNPSNGQLAESLLRLGLDAWFKMDR